MTLITAQSVSAALRRAGWLPTPRNREGVHVTRAFHGAHVIADWNTDARSTVETRAMITALRGQGYVITAVRDMSFTVTGRTA